MTEKTITIETRANGKRKMTRDGVVAFLLARHSDYFEIMIDGKLWTRMNRERNVEEGMNFDEYKVSPHADLTDAEHDYDKDCDWVPALDEDVRSSLLSSAAQPVCTVEIIINRICVPLGWTFADGITNALDFLASEGSITADQRTTIGLQPMVDMEIVSIEQVERAAHESSGSLSNL